MHILGLLIVTSQIAMVEPQFIQCERADIGKATLDPIVDACK